MNQAGLSSQDDQPNQITQAILDILVPFQGDWTGKGRGEYPTLDGFDYLETLHIRKDPGSSYITYEQATELIDASGRSIRKSHWEAGILRPLEDGSVELACVQSGGRIEVMRGKFVANQSIPETLALRFESTLIGNDKRVRITCREWFLSGDHLRYVMKMATDRVDELSLHLEAHLERS